MSNRQSQPSLSFLPIYKPTHLFGERYDVNRFPIYLWRKCVGVFDTLTGHRRIRQVTSFAFGVLRMSEHVDGSKRRSTYAQKSWGPFGLRVCLSMRARAEVRVLVMAIAVVTVEKILVYPDEV